MLSVLRAAWQLGSPREPPRRRLRALSHSGQGISSLPISKHGLIRVGNDDPDVQNLFPVVGVRRAHLRATLLRDVRSPFPVLRVRRAVQLCSRISSQVSRTAEFKADQRLQ